MKGLRAVAVMTALVLAVAPQPAAAQQTREEMAAEQRRARSRELHPAEPGRVERTFLKLSDERWLDRLFNPRRGFFVRVGLPVEGAAFAAGPAWRASDAGRRYTFTASAAGSISREWLGELALQVPDVLPRPRQRSLLCRRLRVAIGTRRERILGTGQRQCRTTSERCIGSRRPPWAARSACG